MKQAILSILILALTACSGGDEGNGKTSDGLATDVVQGDAPTLELLQDLSEEIAKECSPNWVIEFFGIEDGMSFETGKTMAMQARIYDSLLGKTVMGETVTFQLVGDGDATLEQATGVTNDQGVAMVTLNTGTDTAVDYEVIAENWCAGAVSISLNSVAPEQGTIIATFTVNDELAGLWDGSGIDAYADNTIPLCGAVDFTSPHGSPIKLPAGTMEVQFEGAFARSSHVVFGIARNQDGSAIGAGCQENVVVMPDQTEEVQVGLVPLSIEPAGQYDFVLTADLYQLLQPVWVDPGVALLEVVEASDETIAGHVIADVAMYLPDEIPECWEAAQQNIKDSVTTGMGGLPEEVVWLAANAGTYLEEGLTETKLSGILKVDKTDEMGKYAASVDYSELSLAFAGACEGAVCPESTYQKEVFGSSDIDLELAQDEFELLTDGFDGLEIPIVTLSLQPGKVALFAFLSGLVAAQGYPERTAEMFAGMYSCSTMMASLSPQTTLCFNKPPSFLIDSCETAVSNLKLAFYDKVAPMAAPQELVGAGGGLSVDSDGDLKADKLEGEVLGDLMHEGADIGSFIFPFVATR